MFPQKLIILLLVPLIAFLLPQNFSEKQSKRLKTGGSINIDSVYSSIKKNGWTDHNLFQYHQFIINTETDASEFDRINSLPESAGSVLMRALLLKKERSFPEMFDSLLNGITLQPGYLPYYEELVFAAAATNQLARLEVAVKESPELRKRGLNWVLGLLHSAKGEYILSEEYLNKAAARIKNNPFVLIKLSGVQRHLGNYPAASAYLDSVSSYAKDYLIAAEIYNARGALLYLSGSYDKAAKEFKNAFIISDKLGYNLYKAKSLVNLGILDDVNGDIEKARGNFNEAFETAARVKDIETKAHALSELGVSYTYTEELAAAKSNYLKSLELYRASGNRLRISLLLNNIGKIYLNMFNYQAALESFREGIASAGENKRAKVLNLTGMGDTYSNLANYARALSYYKDARGLAEEIQELELSAEVDKGMGVLNYNLNRLDDALRYFKSAETTARNINSVFMTADAYHKIGITYFRMDSVAKSGDYLLKALETARNAGDIYMEAVSSGDIAMLYLSQNRLTESGRYLNSAALIAEKYGLTLLKAEHKILLGQTAEKNNNFNSAVSYYKQAELSAREISNYNLVIESNYLLGRLFEKNGLEEAAVSYYRKAVQMIDDVSRPLFEEQDVQIFYFSSKYDIYNSLAALLLNQNRFEEAFELIDRSRSRSLIQNLNNIKLQSVINDRKLLDSLYDYEWRVHSGLEEGKELNLSYSAFKKELAEDFPAAAKYLNLKPGYSISDVQRELGDKEEFISIFSSDTKTYIFRINERLFKTYVVEEGKEKLKNYLAQISPYFDKNLNTAAYFNQDLFAYNNNNSAALYNKFFKPLFSDIPQGSQIIAALSAELISFPLEFLLTNYREGESVYNYEKGRYLVNDYGFSYIQSAASYIEQKNNNLKNNGEVLLAGDPEINTDIEGFADRRGLLEETPGIPRNFALLPLKYSGEELNDVGEQINADKILLKKEATETRFKQNAELNSIIHISSHSFLFNKQPVIFFSNFYDPENDGFLEAAEIVRLKLNSDLVVLSSCNSGLGAVDEPEGILGMTRAFFEAGTRSVVVSLWEVNDQYTSKFMVLFYEHLSRGLTKSEALRRAKIDFMREYSPNPYYWGAFVLNGNIDPVKIDAGSEVNVYLIGGVILFLLFASIAVFRKKQKVKPAFD